MPQIRHASWTGYILKGEPPAVSKAWRAAADAASNAIWAEETLHDRKGMEESRDALYASLRALRKLGAIKLHTQGRQTSMRSALMTKGEAFERRMKADVPILGLGFASTDL